MFLPSPFAFRFVVRALTISCCVSLSVMGPLACSSGGGVYDVGPSDASARYYPPPSPTSASGTRDASAPSTSTPPGLGTSSGPLRIVSLTATVSTLTLYPLRPSETVETEIVAIVTHSGGSERIAGGQLEDASGHVYGAFQTGANKGTLSLHLDWMGISAVAPLNASKGEEKPFIGKFFDNDGHQVAMTVALKFQCRVLEGALTFQLPASLPPNGILTGAYDGKCFDDTHCGKAGQACGSGTSCSVQSETCEPVTLAAGHGCVDRDEFPWLSTGCGCGAPNCTAGSCTCIP